MVFIHDLGSLDRHLWTVCLLYLIFGWVWLWISFSFTHPEDYISFLEIYNNRNWDHCDSYFITWWSNYEKNIISQYLITLIKYFDFSCNQIQSNRKANTLPFVLLFIGIFHIHRRNSLTISCTTSYFEHYIAIDCWRFDSIVTITFIM